MERNNYYWIENDVEKIKRKGTIKKNPNKNWGRGIGNFTQNVKMGGGGLTV
jgi:hypothetical protein